jgi:ABC-type transport system involved in multi-copper enzyme maturation permease subunit
MLRAARLAYRMQRFELRLLLGAALLLAVAALAIAWQTRVVRDEQLACYREAPTAVQGSLGSPCSAQDSSLQVLEQGATFVKLGILGTPILLGLFLGIPLVAREVESRTAQVAWTLSRSRRRWLLQRATPIFGAVIVACLAGGIAGDVLVHAAPWVEGGDPGFSDWWARGPQVAVRGVAVGAIGLAVGAFIGRQLPALLLAGLCTLALFVSASLILDGWMEAAAEPVVVGPVPIVCGKIYGSSFRDDATGEVVSYEQAYDSFGESFGEEIDEFGNPIGYSQVYFMVPSSRYGEFVLYEAALFGMVALAGIGATVQIVANRRP